MSVKLSWHCYKYYPYERSLAAREVASLIKGAEITERPGGLELVGNIDASQAARLTYFSEWKNGSGGMATQQARLELAANAGKNKQSTRYSVHGLHEYKGKFNPQVAKAILNIFDIHPGDRVLDPFCGSGTTLVECAHLGVAGYGTDLNPLAVYLANAKLLALSLASAELQQQLSKLRKPSKRLPKIKRSSDARTDYLAAWFTSEMHDAIENLKHHIEATCGNAAPVFLAIASNLLRDYSLQDPIDLRIRRRKSPLPSTPLFSAFVSAAEAFIGRLSHAQDVIPPQASKGTAIRHDIISSSKPFSFKFDAAITSPPYAMALPYIDTQRLSLVWLGLLPPSQILKLESDLVGSREFRGEAKRLARKALETNADGLPHEQAKFCLELFKALGPTDGFRRQAVPDLLYRYFTTMRSSFRNIRKLMKRRAPYALIVGHNHTTLGGTRFDIDTPTHLASLAQSVGWKVDELFPLQTYHRYGYHMKNAVGAETLILLRNP
jgi:site-specific DNA-methyltransferase (cytosine-N4-specific)